MVRIMRWIVRNTIRMIGPLLRMLIFILRFVLPWIIRVVRTSLLVMSSSIISVFVGLPTSTDRIASYWSEQAFDVGFPTMYDHELYNILRGVAYIVIVLGWFMLAILALFSLKATFDLIW